MIVSVFLAVGLGNEFAMLSSTAVTPHIFVAEPQKTGTIPPFMMPSWTAFIASLYVMVSPAKNFSISSSLVSAMDS